MSVIRQIVKEGFNDGIFKIPHNRKKVNIKLAMVKGFSSDFALITFSDITSMQLLEKAKQMERFRNIYFQSMAHDLRTPLVTIISANENLEIQYPNDPFIKNIVRLSSSSCHYLIQTFEQV